MPTKQEHSYRFKTGLSQNYRFKEMTFPTLQEARDAARKERLTGYSPSRIEKVSVMAWKD